MAGPFSPNKEAKQKSNKKSAAHSDDNLIRIDPYVVHLKEGYPTFEQVVVDNTAHDCTKKTEDKIP